MIMKNMLLVTIVGLLSLMTLNAQPLSGIHVEAGRGAVVVYLDGQQMSLPTQSCFISNLDDGQYLVEVYQAASSSVSGAYNKVAPIYKNYVQFYQGHIMDINVAHLIAPDSNSSMNGDDAFLPQYNYGIMSPSVFTQFLQELEDEFNYKRSDMIQTALLTSRFTCQQCVALMQLWDFDSDRIDLVKQIYPSIVDKQNAILLFSALDFDHSKDSLRSIIRSASSN